MSCSKLYSVVETRTSEGDETLIEVFKVPMSWIHQEANEDFVSYPKKPPTMGEKRFFTCIENVINKCVPLEIIAFEK